MSEVTREPPVPEFQPIADDEVPDYLRRVLTPQIDRLFNIHDREGYEYTYSAAEGWKKSVTSRAVNGVVWSEPKCVVGEGPTRTPNGWDGEATSTYLSDWKKP